MSDLRKGQKVRVTFDAVYDAYFGETCTHLIYSDRRGMEISADAIVEPIEDLRPGDVYRTAYGSVVCYVDRELPYKSWLVVIPSDDCVNPGDWLLDQSVERPLTLLMRDGQPVMS